MGTGADWLWCAREVRPSPAHSCLPQGLPGVAQSHLPCPADLSLFTACFCIALLRSWNVHSVKRGSKVLTFAFNCYLYFWKGVSARIKYLVGIKFLLSTFCSCLVCSRPEVQISLGGADVQVSRAVVLNPSCPHPFSSPRAEVAFAITVCS